jgi:hypothetical protein
MEPKVWTKLGNCSATELHLQLQCIDSELAFLSMIVPAMKLLGLS